jgi:single-strand DNA-binding protein
LRQTPNGKDVVNFSLALNRAYRDSGGEWQEATDFIDVVAWGPLAERVAQYMSKGRRCLVQGRLQSRSWEQDGQKRNKVEVLAGDVTFLDGGGGSRDDNSDNNNPPTSNTSSNKKTTTDKKTDVKIEDIDDEPINLDYIPF